MANDYINERWQQIAIEIGDRVRASVNTAEMIDTDAETGYILMFFSARNHGGKSTFVSSLTDKDELKRLLKFALKQIDRAEIIEPGQQQ